MKLPKDLTPQLLALVMGMEVSNSMEQHGITRIREISEHEDGLSLDFGYQGAESSYGRYVWIDTLTRLMKEWIVSDIKDVDSLCSLESYLGLDGYIIKVKLIKNSSEEEKQVKSKIEFLGILEVLIWVAREKKLLV